MPLRVRRCMLLLCATAGLLWTHSVALAQSDHDAYKFVSLNLPAGTSQTGINGINNSGHVVGVYVTADGQTHGFSAKGAGHQLITIDFPGSTSTHAVGINSLGDIVGNYMLSGVNHG